MILDSHSTINNQSNPRGAQTCSSWKKTAAAGMAGAMLAAVLTAGALPQNAYAASDVSSSENSTGIFRKESSLLDRTLSGEKDAVPVPDTAGQSDNGPGQSSADTSGGGAAGSSGFAGETDTLPDAEVGTQDSLTMAEEEKREEVVLRAAAQKQEREEAVRRAQQTAEEEKIRQAALAAEEAPLEGEPASAKAIRSLSALQDLDSVSITGTIRTLPEEMLRLLEEASRNYEPEEAAAAENGSGGKNTSAPADRKQTASQAGGKEQRKKQKGKARSEGNYTATQGEHSWEIPDTEVGWVMVDLTTGGVVSYHPQYLTYSASSIKAPYIFCLLSNGKKPTNDMYLAGHYSDNAAYLRLRAAYGADIMKEWLSDAGVDAEEGNKAYTDLTSIDLAKMWCHAYDYVSGGQKNSAWLAKTFSDSANSMISQTIGTRVQTYSKAGWITPNDTRSHDPEYNVYTNAGIVFSDHPYVVAITSYNTPTVGMEKTKYLLTLLDAAHTQMFETAQ